MTALLAVRLGERPADETLLRPAMLSNDRELQALFDEIAGEQMLQFAPLLIEAWGSAEPARRTRIADRLAGDPLLSLESRWPEKAAQNEPCSDGPDVQAWFAPSRVQNVLSAWARAPFTDDADRSALLARLAGLRQQLAFSPASPLSAAAKTKLATTISASDHVRFPAQLTLVPSYRCSRSCAYCFNRELGATSARELSLDDARKALDVVSSEQRLVKVSLFGGEPTESSTMLAFLSEFSARGLSCFFSTNGLCHPDLFRELVKSSVLEMVTVHVDDGATYRQGERKVLLQNIRALAERGLQIVLRYNLHQHSIEDRDMLSAALAEVPHGTFFSFAVAFPRQRRENDHVSLAQLDGLAPRIVQLVRFLRRFPVLTRIVLCKPFPLCAFGSADLTFLLSIIEYHNICEVDRRGFTAQAQLEPDMSMTPCMALTGPRLRVEGPRPFSELSREFGRSVAPLLGTPMRGECRQCSLLAVGACQTACFTYVT